MPRLSEFLTGDFRDMLGEQNTATVKKKRNVFEKECRTEKPRVAVRNGKLVAVYDRLAPLSSDTSYDGAVAGVLVPHRTECMASDECGANEDSSFTWG